MSIVANELLARIKTEGATKAASDMLKADAAFGKVATSAASAAKPIRELFKAIEGASGAVTILNAFKTAMAGAAPTRFANSTQKAADSLRSLSAVTNDGVGAAQKLGAAYTTLAGAMGRQSGSAARVASSTNQTGNAASKSSGFISRLAAAFKEAEIGANRANGGIGILGATIASTLGNVAANGITALATKTKDFFTTAITGAGDFEANMANFQIAAALDTTGLEQFKNLFIEIGKELPVSTSEVQMAATEMVKGGIDPAILAAGGLKDGIQFATAAQLDLVTAAELSANTIGAWTGVTDSAADKTKFLSDAQNNLVAIANASTLGVADLNAGMNVAAGSAKSLGVNHEELGKAIALTRSAYNSATETGTGYKNFLNQLTPSTDPAIASMKQLGLMTTDNKNRFFDANGAYIGNRDAAILLQQALAPLSAEQKSVAVSTIFGNDAAGTAIALAGGGAQAYDNLTASLDKQLSVQDAAAAKSDLFNTAQSNLSGSVEALGLVIGGAVLPVLSEFVNGLSGGINAVTSFVQGVLAAPDPLAAFFAQLDGIIPGLGALAQDAFSWGSGIVEQLGAGMQQAFSFVVGVMQQIGSIISYWLQPNSPPKIVPDLDKYGKDAAQLYMDSWVPDDYSMLQDIGNTVDQMLSGLVDAGKFGEEGVIPAVLGTRSAVEEAINSLYETGEVGQEALDKLRDAAGPAGDTAVAMFDAYIELADATHELEAAQAELNATTKEYDDRLAPINAELDALGKKKKLLQDEQRVAKLNEKIADGESTDTERQIALIEIEEITKRNQLDAVEDEKDVAVNAAKEKVDAAKSTQDAAKQQLDTQKAALDSFNQQNQLIGQQIDLVDRLAKASEAAAKAGSGGGGGAIKLPKPGGYDPLAGGGIGGIEMPTFDAAAITGPLDTIKTSISDAKLKFTEFKDGLTDTATTIQTTVNPAIAAFRDGITTTQSVLAPLVPIVVGVAAGFAAFAVLAPIAGMIASAAGAWAAFSGALAGGSGVLGTVVALLGGPVTVAIGAIALAIGLFAAAWAGNWGNIQGVMANVMAAIQPALDGLRTNFELFITNVTPGWQNLTAAFAGATPIFTAIAAIIGGLLVGALGFLSGILPGLGLAFTGVLDVISGVINIVSGLIIGLVSIVGKLIQGDWQGVWASAVEMVVKVAVGIGQVIGGLVEVIFGLIGGLVAGVIGFFANLYDVLVGHSIVPDMADAIVQVISDMVTGFLDLVSGLITDAIAKFEEFKTGVSTVLTNALALVTGVASSWKSAGTALIQNVIDGIKGMAQSAMNAVGDVLQSVRDMLPGSEPKDSSSPLSNLGHAGKAFVSNFVNGIIAGRPLLLREVSGMAQDARNVLLQQGATLAGEFLRTQLAALNVVQELAPDLQGGVQAAFNAAEKHAAELRKTDAATAQAYYDLKVKQISELAALQQKQKEAESQADKDRIQAQMDLLALAHNAEMIAFEQTVQVSLDQAREAANEVAQNASDVLREAGQVAADAAKDAMKDLLDRVKSFMRESLQGLAGLARGRAGTRRAIMDMLPDPSKVKELQDKLAELTDEEARLTITAAQNDSADKREAAAARLVQLAAERAKLEKETLEAQRMNGLQGQIAANAQRALAQAEQEAMKIRAYDPAQADEYYALKSGHILEIAQLEQDLVNATDDDSRRLIREQLALIRGAQTAELAAYDERAKQRATETADLKQDSKQSLIDFGSDFNTILRDALALFGEAFRALSPLAPDAKIAVPGIGGGYGGPVTRTASPGDIGISGYQSQKTQPAQPITNNFSFSITGADVQNEDRLIRLIKDTVNSQVQIADSKRKTT